MDLSIGSSRYPADRRRRLALALSTMLALVALAGVAPARVIPAAAGAEPTGAASVGTYHNPLPLTIPNGGGRVESCADPTVIRGVRSQDRPTGSPPSDRYWYLYCTKDPLNDDDRSKSGFNFNVIPMFRSADLVHWRYMGNAFPANPAWATPNAGVFAPEVDYIDGTYHLYYTVTDVIALGGGSAIGVATSDGPLGPWTDKGSPVVEPHGADCCGSGSRRNVFDPEVIRAAGTYHIYYGSYFGGISVRDLSDDGLTSDPLSQTNVAISNKFEGPEVVRHGGMYYLFVSATDCCRGPLTGYSVFVGRSSSPTGPFLDRDGHDLNDNEGPGFEDPASDPTDGRAGGTPALSMNGNRWVGPGHNTVFQDLDGQTWTIYHAIDRNDPYFANGVDIFDGNCGAEGQPAQPCGDLNKRPVLLDPVYWDAAGWPNVRAGRWASDETMPAPAAQPGQHSAYSPVSPWRSGPGALIASRSDEFSGGTLGPQWSWIRQPADSSTYGVGKDGTFRFETQNADLFVKQNTASILVEDAPAGDFIVDVKMKLDVPAEGCCFNFRQGGVVIYGNDNNYLKLVDASIWNTRQTEWAKEEAPVPDGYPRYGNSVVGAPEDWTYLRIIRTESNSGREEYQAFTRTPGHAWTRGGTWTHDLTSGPGPVRIGLVSMGAGGPASDPNAVSTSTFDYLRVYAVDVRPPTPLP